jgi:di/tricarboxylate transporter
MTPQIALTLAIIGVAILLFATEKLRVDVIALIVLLTVALTGLVTPEEAFAGFANPAVVTVWAVYIVSGALFKTGVADIMGRGILRLAGASEPRLIAVIMLTCGVMSGLMNNVGATAMLLPAVVGISRRTKVPVSRLLIPLSFSSLLGGKLTLIGTPANILGTGILADRGLPAFRFFDFTPIGAIFLGTGIAYMLLAGRHLLPSRETSADLTDNFRLRDYLTEVRVLSESPLVGKTVVESRFGQDYDLTIVGRVGDPPRAPDMRQPPAPGTKRRRLTMRWGDRIQAGDVLIVSGSLEIMLRIKEAQGLEVLPDVELGDAELTTEDAAIAEVLVSARSELTGKSLKEFGFREKYNLTVLALWRHGEPIYRKLANEPMQFADVLLVQGRRDRIHLLRTDPNFLLLEPVELETRRTRKAPIAVGVMALVLALVLLAGFHISTAMVIGSVLMVLTGCLTMDEAYQSIDWRTVFLVAGMLPLGTAMETTGAARFLADLLLSGVGGLGPLAVLAGIYVLVALITQPMSNAAAVVLITPIAIDTALSLGANPQPFVLATILGAATSFLTPVGHKANVLVFGPGGYRFFDFTRVGAPLTLVLLIVTMVFLPILWPLF